MSLADRLRRPLRTLRQDVAAATAMLRGQAPSPFTPRTGAAWPVPTAAQAGRELRVHAVDALTEDAVRLRLVPVDGRPMPFRAGQFLTVCIDSSDGELRRAYSICSDPARTDALAVAVKAVPGGRVSPRLVHESRPGDVLRVFGPSGRFGHPLDPTRARTHVLVAGGSGVTPMLALLHAILATEPDSRAVLILGNRRKRDRMLVDELQALSERSGDRLIWRDVLERPYPRWKGGRGRLDGEGLAAQLAALDLAPGPGQAWYLCGPGGMLDACEAWLLDAGLSADQLAIERFTAAPRRAAEVVLPDDPQPVTLQTRRGLVTVSVPPGQTILAAARAAGLALPFSCAMGGCGACTQTLVSGQVHLRAPNCLGEAERAAGAVLTCVAHPLGPVTIDLRGTA